MGTYRYDSARPDRLMRVTLSAPGGATPLSGTRTLAYTLGGDNITVASERTLTFVHGPEHQRVRQTEALSGAAGNSAYFAGDVWYLKRCSCACCLGCMRFCRQSNAHLHRR